MVGYNPEVYFLFLDFGHDVTALLQMVKLNDNVMTLYVHCFEPSEVFEEFVQWFFWIFSAKEE